MLVRNKLLVAGLCVGCFAFSSIAAEKIDGIAAVIGDSVILLSEVDAYSLLRLNALGQKIDSSELPKLRKQFLTELIDGKVLIVHAAKDTTIILKEAEIEQAQNSQIQNILQQNNMSLGTLEQELKSKYNMSLAKFKSQMYSQIREQLIRQKVQQQYIAGVQVTRKDVEEFFHTYRDSFPPMGESILVSKLVVHISPSDSLRQTAYTKISGIKKRLDNGEDFSQLAKQYSDDPNAGNGGDLGFIKKGTLNELAFEERAFSLNPGQTSDIFESRLGFHIISLLAKKEQMVHIRQLFIKVTPPEELIQKVMTRLDSIKTHCTGQQDFIAAVRQWSTDNQSKANSGRMGWIAVYELSETLRGVLDSLKPGDISSPVKGDDNDYTIYRIDDRKAQRQLTLEDDYNLLAEKTKEIIAQKKLLELVKKWQRDVFIDLRI